MTDLEPRRRADPTEWLKRLVLALCALVLSLFVVGMLGGLVLYLSKTHPFLRTYSLAVVFPNAQGVEAGAPVKMAGVSIGTVEQVTLEGQQANLHLQI